MVLQITTISINRIVIPNNGDGSSGYGFLNSHTLSQYDDSITFKYMDGDVKKGNVSSGYVSISSRIVYQHNGLKSLMNYNDRDDIDMNTNSQNVYVSSGIGLLNIHTLLRYNESSQLNEINIGVENVDVNGGHFI